VQGHHDRRARLSQRWKIDGDSENQVYARGLHPAEPSRQGPDPSGRQGSRSHASDRRRRAAERVLDLVLHNLMTGPTQSSASEATTVSPASLA